MATFTETFPSSSIIRSSFCAANVMAGTRLFLIDLGSKFMVTTRFQIIGTRKNLEAATALFERTLLGA